MIRRLFIVLLLFPLLAQAEPVLPDTPAAKIADEWLDAINSGDRVKLQAFKDRYKRETSIEDNLQLRAETGGFTVLRVLSDDPHAVGLLVGEKASDTVARLDFSVNPDKPTEIAKVTLDITERPGDLAIARLSQASALSALSERVERLEKQDAFSGAVLIAKHGKTILDKTAGMADRASGKVIDATTQFRLGSMNKMFTAVAILQFVEAGKLSLDTRLGEVLADYPNRNVADKVRIRHLLTHTGGTGDFFGPEFDAHRLELKTHADYLRMFGARGPEFEPGSQARYSNYGFILLGAVIEKLSGTTYYDHLQASVFAPAGMRDTASPAESEAVPQRANGYLRKDGAWASNVDTLPWRGTAAGGGLSTTADLARFAAALENGTLLPKRLLAQATSAQSPQGGYGYGFAVAGTGALRRYGHGGGAPGMNAELLVVPKSATVIVVLSNFDPPVANQLAEFYLNRMPVEP